MHCFYIVLNKQLSFYYNITVHKSYYFVKLKGNFMKNIKILGLCVHFHNILYSSSRCLTISKY